MRRMQISPSGSVRNVRIIIFSLDPKLHQRVNPDSDVAHRGSAHEDYYQFKRK